MRMNLKSQLSSTIHKKQQIDEVQMYKTHGKWAIKHNYYY